MLFSVWQPYATSNASCGSDYITGVGGEITTPGYPLPFEPRLSCTWMIRVKYDELILLNMLELDLGTNGEITLLFSFLFLFSSFLYVFNGFALTSISDCEPR